MDIKEIITEIGALLPIIAALDPEIRKDVLNRIFAEVRHFVDGILEQVEKE